MMCSLIGITMKSGESVTFSCEPDCSLFNQEFDILSGNQATENVQYSCWEQHLYWGGLILSFTFLPGVVLFIRLLQSKEVRKSCRKIIYAILASVFFPLTLFAAKIISLFQFGEEWKRVATLITACEGLVESFLQVGLQLYIIFSRPNQDVSTFQAMALFGSFFMISLGQVKTAFANRTSGASTFEDIKEMTCLTFLSLTMIFYLIFTAVFTALIDKIPFFVCCGAIAILPLTYLYLTRIKSSYLLQNGISKRKSKLKLIMLSVSCLIGLIAFIICLVMFNMDPESYSKFALLKTQLVGNILFGAFSVCNLLGFILHLSIAFSKKLNFCLPPYYF